VRLFSLEEKALENTLYIFIAAYHQGWRGYGLPNLAHFLYIEVRVIGGGPDEDPQALRSGTIGCAVAGAGRLRYQRGR
jgi:hypothetical protein